MEWHHSVKDGTINYGESVMALSLSVQMTNKRKGEKSGIDGIRPLFPWRQKKG